VATSVESTTGRVAVGPSDRAGRLAAWAGRPWVLRCASILLVLGLWEWGGTAPVNIAFPKCSETLVAFGDMLLDGTFAGAYAETAGPLLVGVLLTRSAACSPASSWACRSGPSGWACPSSSCCRRRRRRPSSR
jgi:hypothetical protein